LVGELPEPGDPGSTTYTVAGVYRAETVRTASRFWFDSEDFEYAPPTSFGGETLPARLDAVLVAPELLLSLRTVPDRVQLEYHVRARAAAPPAPTGAQCTGF
jgi:hypothetical protein